MAKVAKKEKSEKKVEKVAKKDNTTYNLYDFSKGIAKDLEGVSSGQVKKILSDFCEAIESSVTGGELEAGDAINMPGLGKFVVVQRKPRNARNPKTGETFMAPARKAVKFKMAAKLRIWGKPPKEVSGKKLKKSKK